MKINVSWETGCGRRDAGCATGHIIDHAALRKSSITSKKAFKGVQRVVFGCNGTALIRLYSANSPYFAFFRAGAIFGSQFTGERRTIVLKMLQKQGKNLVFARLCRPFLLRA